MSKKWALRTLVLMFTSLLLIAALVIIVDPLMFFHKPVSAFGYTIKDDAYQNPGIAKNFDYDAVLVGSSMTQNFSTNMIDDMFDVKSVKLCYSGAYAKTINKILGIAFENQKIDTVFWGIDTYALTADVDYLKYDLPEYLYDKNIFNDIKYVFNKTLIFSSLKVLYKMRSGQPNTTMDEAYSWYHLAKDKFVPQFALTLRQKDAEPQVGGGEIYNENAYANLRQNMAPIIKANPDTEFNFFFVPDSIWAIKDRQIKGTLEGSIKAQQIVVAGLLEYDNVNVYYFKNIESIICDPSNYMDRSHFAIGTNVYILESMLANQHQLTKDNYISEIEKLQTLADKYDIEILEN